MFICLLWWGCEITEDFHEYLTGKNEHKAAIEIEMIIEEQLGDVDADPIVGHYRRQLYQIIHPGNMKENQTRNHETHGIN
jgi:hypothetical protein